MDECNDMNLIFDAMSVEILFIAVDARRRIDSEADIQRNVDSNFIHRHRRGRIDAGIYFPEGQPCYIMRILISPVARSLRQTSNLAKPDLRLSIAIRYPRVAGRFD